MLSSIHQLIQNLRRRFTLPPQDLLRDVAYRRLWTSILISSLGGQVTMLALPLTAAVLLHASPTQMGILVAMEIAPFVLLSLPAGVWLDRVKKLPVYVAGSAAQIVLTQVVPRERLIEAHSRNALASSGAEVAGPGFAGALIKAAGAPVALLLDALALIFSVLILRGIRINEVRPVRKDADFWRDLKAGIRFVRGTPLLVTMALTVGFWQMCHHAAIVVQILFATRTLGLNEAQIGLAFVGLGAGTVMASVFGRRISDLVGPGPALLLGVAISGLGWLVLAAAPASKIGGLAFGLMLFLFGVGAVMIFINFLSLRQSVTPEPLLGRMTSTMRWLILLPAGPGAVIGGALGEHVSLRAALVFAGVSALLVAATAWQHGLLRGVRSLPKPEDHSDELGAEASVVPQQA
jgi:MFS family permease